MRPAILFALPLAASACVPLALPGAVDATIPPGEVRVAAAEASPDRLTLRMSNGERCIAERPEGETGGWSGVMAECPYPLPYMVTFQQGGAAQRFVIEDPTGFPSNGSGGPGPRAEVFVTDVNGARRLFVAPLGPNVRFGAPES